MANFNVVLAENASATTSGVFVPGGRMMFSAEATFGGGTVSLEMQLPNGSWVACGTDTTLAANGAAIVELPGNVKVRVAIATATGVYANLYPF